MTEFVEVLDERHRARAFLGRTSAELGEDAFVITTGGLADPILAETDVSDVHDPMLTLKGLRLYYERNVGAESKLHIPRGLNQLWNAGGIQYAPPIR